jgi:hypothetical protein
MSPASSFLQHRPQNTEEVIISAALLLLLGFRQPAGAQLTACAARRASALLPALCTNFLGSPSLPLSNLSNVCVHACTAPTHRRRSYPKSGSRPASTNQVRRRAGGQAAGQEPHLSCASPKPTPSSPLLFLKSLRGLSRKDRRQAWPPFPSSCLHARRAAARSPNLQPEQAAQRSAAGPCSLQAHTSPPGQSPPCKRLNPGPKPWAGGQTGGRVTRVARRAGQRGRQVGWPGGLWVIGLTLAALRPRPGCPPPQLAGPAEAYPPLHPPS